MRRAPLPARMLWNAFFWTFERATWQYDVMVIAILAFVWLVPPDWLKDPEGSALIRAGETWVICTASVEEKVPPFLKDTGRGWVTAEYAMLPRATNTRGGRSPGGRGKEIERLIGRALRASIDMAKLGQRTITIDCDVLQADGGTRTASI